MSTESDPEAQARLRDEIVLLNVGVARTIARRYHDRGMEADDVDQIAYMALVRALRGFDHGRGYDFLTYAVPTIRGEIKRHFRDHDWVSAVEARSIAQLLVRRLDARDQRVVSLRYVHEWTQKSIADDLGITQMQVSRILSRIHQHLRAELSLTELPDTRTAS